MLSLPIAFSSVIGVFAPVFSRPVWQHVKVLLTGAVLAPSQRTVTAILRMMGRSAAPDFQTYHRVLNRAVWSPLKASRLLLRLLGAVFIPRGVVVLGLDDTIEPWDARAATGTGFKFTDYSGEALLLTIKEALKAFRDQSSWQTLMRNGMNKDFSWSASAKEYIRVYERARQLRTGNTTLPNRPEATDLEPISR